MSEENNQTNKAEVAEDAMPETIGLNKVPFNVDPEESIEVDGLEVRDALFPLQYRDNPISMTLKQVRESFEGIRNQASSSNARLLSVMITDLQKLEGLSHFMEKDEIMDRMEDEALTQVNEMMQQGESQEEGGTTENAGQ